MLAQTHWTIERRLSSYFIVMYGAMGLTGPFFAPWLHHLGIKPELTGVIVALPSIGMVLTSVYLGSVADRLPDWRSAIIASDWVVFLLLCWMLVRQQVVDIMIVWTLAGLLIATKVPVLDAATISLARKRGVQYSRIRALGSLGFVIALMFAGWIFDTAGFEWFVPVLVAGALLRALWSGVLPRFREPSVIITKETRERLAAPAANLGAAAGNITASGASLVSPELNGGLRHPGFLLVIAGSALISASHAFFGAFGMVYWIETGISAALSSILWCVAVVSEIILMWCFTDIARRLSARYCMIAAGGAGIVRWSLSTTEPLVPLLFFLQALHALSFGLLFIATVNFIARRVDDSMAARAQALSATFTTGALALAVIASGTLYARFGSMGYWLMICMCLLGIVLILTSYWTQLEEHLLGS